MHILKRTGQAFIGVSILGFVWLVWFLLATPASSFDTQGPGILGALVMFASQVSGVFGVILLSIWWIVSWERRLNTAREVHQTMRQGPTGRPGLRPMIMGEDRDYWLGSREG